MNNIPATPLKPKESKVAREIVDQLVFFMELEMAVAQYLQVNKRLSPQLGFKLDIEIRLITNIIKNIIGLPLDMYRAKADLAKKESGFDDEVVAMADALAPKPPLIIPPDQCVGEVMRLRQQRKGKWSWAM